MKSSNRVVFKHTQAYFHTLHWFWEDAISLCRNPTLHTQEFLTNSSGTESSKHNVLYCTYIKITFKRTWHSPAKDFGTPAPHPACLRHPGVPTRPWDSIHDQKSLSTRDSRTGSLPQRRAGERAEHRTQAPHPNSLQFLPLSSSQSPGKHQLLSVLELQEEPSPPFPISQPNAQITGLSSSWLPFPFSWTEAATLN